MSDTVTRAELMAMLEAPEITRLRAHLAAALDLLLAHDRAWREGTPPPIEKGRALLLECGRSLEVRT